AQKLESVGRLAGGVAHDFNNLLTVMLGNVSIAREIVGPGHAVNGPLVEIEDAAERAAALTRELLAFSRRQVLDPRVIDLGVIMADNEDFCAACSAKTSRSSCRCRQGRDMSGSIRGTSSRL
ncbi:MAG TPA: histidine kinase dimerization/phospho-acceptor domain-containing protein, partial [Vicinamibacterales bacterium]|nr:histidine kinase dimerization/phospho-acceptor domain-containing protein [Vicinamibacterales bacterium]